MPSRSILKRRELLLSLGSASFLGIPVFRETLAEAQAASFPVRFIPIYLPGNSTNPRSGENIASYSFRLDGVLSALAPFASESLFFTLDNNAGSALWGRTSEPHAAAITTLLTGNSSAKANGDTITQYAVADSIDQIIAAQIGTQTKFSSIEAGVVTETHSNGPLQARMSFRQGVAQPPIQSPMALLSRLFSGGAPPPAPTPSGSTPKVPAPMVDTSADGKSMLDALIAEVTELKAVGGIGEQAKLDQHLTSLRELEKQIVTTTPGMPNPGGGGGVGVTPGSGCMAPALASVPFAQSYPPGSGPSPDIPNVTSQQFELLYQALVCDLTRVGSMQLLCSAHTEVSYDWLGIKDDHHALEHNQASGTGPSLNKVQSFFSSEIATFLNRLKSTPEGSGTMLDNSVVLFFTDFSDSSGHSHDQLPFYVFGRGGGKITPGRNIPGGGHTNLLRGLINVFGVDKPVGDDGGGPAMVLG